MQDPQYRVTLKTVDPPGCCAEDLAGSLPAARAIFSRRLDEASGGEGPAGQARRFSVTLTRHDPDGKTVALWSAEEIRRRAA